MSKKGVKNIFNNIGKIFSYIFLVVLIFIALFLLLFIGINAYSKATNSKPLFTLYTIVSPSMEPTIMVNDVIFVTKVSSDDDLNVGDIITFYSHTLDTGGYTVTHRIYKKYEKNGTIYYETKGDNNSLQDDGRITFDDVVGKYKFKINQLGKLQFLVSSPFGWLLIVLVPAIIIISKDIIGLIKLRSIKKNIDSIPDNKELLKKKEKERDKKIRALIEKADKNNKNK